MRRKSNSRRPTPRAPAPPCPHARTRLISMHTRLARRRLSLYSGRTCPGQGMRVVLRRGAELVRLPFA